MASSVPTEVSFTHVVLEGTPYEVGRLQGEMLKDDPVRANYLTPTLPFLKQYTRREAHQALAYFEKYCPGIGEEVQGAADAFGVPLEDVAFLGGRSMKNDSSNIPVDETVSRGGSHCSHFAVLPSAAENARPLVGRSMEFSPAECEMRLCTTRVRGQAAHVGFSDMIFGRIDGINEHGLCVTESWGAPNVWLAGEGVPHFVVVRALLDRCKTVAQALDVIAGIPIAWCTNFVVADRCGEAALIEVAYAHRAVKRIGPGSQEQFVWATNHYTLPTMIAHDAGRMRQSVARHKTIESRLRSAVPHVNKEAIRAILSEPIPKGVCVHHYAGGLGTLWSMIFDLMDASAEICFGAPSSERNLWHYFDLQGPVGATEYRAYLPDEPAAPGFWKRLPPGMDD